MREMGPAQGQTPGLLSLLALKSMGNQPDTLSSSYAPTIDLREWLLTNNSQVNAYAGTVPNGASSGPVSPTAGTLIVPSDEIWYVWNITLIATMGPAATENLQGLAVLLANTGLISRIVALNPNAYVGVAGGSTQVYAYAEPRRFVPAFTTFFATWTRAASAVGGFPWSLQLETTRLKI